MAGLRDVLAWIQFSALGVFMRQSGPWTYGIVNLVHILGVATLFGAILLLGLHLIGLWRRAPLGGLARTVVPVASVYSPGCTPMKLGVSARLDPTIVALTVT